MVYIVEILRENEYIIVTLELFITAKIKRPTTKSLKLALDWMHALFNYNTRTDNKPTSVHSSIYYLDDVKSILNITNDRPTLLQRENQIKIAYTLPASPRLALDFLSIIDTMAAERMVSAYIDHQNKKRFTDHQLAKYIANKILSVTEPPEKYQEALSAIKKIYDATLQSSITFTDCQDLVKRHSLLTDSQLDLGDTLTPTADKMRALNTLVCHFTATHRNAELTDMLNNFNRAAKIKLFAPCIGKDAHDKLVYSWTYSEWFLIKTAKFTIRTDGKVGIPLKDNPAYLKDYAPGKTNEPIFKDEIDFLFPLLNLQIEPDCNLHDEIVFTEACSKRLIAMGLHIDADYVKQLIAFKNKIAIFGQAYRQPWGNGQNNTSFMPAVPKDIFRHLAKQQELSAQVLENREQLEFLQLGFFRPQCPTPAASPLSSAASAAVADQTTHLERKHH